MTTPTGGVYLNTRVHSRRCDYRFVGRAPATSWWRDYSGLTSFEQPTVLVESDSRIWRLYVSGIGSTRRDAVGTVIRYTVVLEGRVKPKGGRAEMAAAVVAACLADQTDGTRTLGTALDSAFPEEDIERLYAATDVDADAAAQEVRQQLLGALRTLPRPEPTVAAPPAGGWLRGLEVAEERTAFLRHTRGVLAGARARSAELNLVDRIADLEPLLADDRPLVVLAPEPAETGDITEPRPAVEPPSTAGGRGKAPGRPAPAGRTPPRRRGRSRRRAVVVVPALVILVAAVLVILLLA